MNTRILTPAALALLAASAFGVTIPATEDTYSVNAAIKTSYGKATTLAVGPTKKAFVRFDLATLPSIIDPAYITDARLRVYLTSVKLPGNSLDVSVVNNGPAQLEDNPALLPEPALAPPAFASVAAGMLKAKRFVYVNVTDEVLAALAGNKRLDVAFTSNTLVTLGAKEGAATGYPAELEIDLDLAALATDTNGEIKGSSIASGSVGTSQLASNLTLGGTTSGTFSGNGSALTNLTAANVTGQLSNSQLANNSVTVTTSGGLSGGGTVALGGTLNLGTSATSANSANTLVARDASGNFAAGTISGAFSGDGNALTNLAAGNINGTLVNAQIANPGVVVNTGTGLSGGGPVALGGTLNLANTGVVSLSGGGGITVSGNSGSITLGSTATSANTASAIVARDASGNFSAGTISATFSGNGASLTNLTAGNLVGTVASNTVATGSLQDGAVTPVKSAADCAVFYEEAAYNVDSPAATNGWLARNLTGGDTSLASSMSRAGNTITLQPGTYYIEADAPAYAVGKNQLVLRDVTVSSAGDPTNTTAVIRGVSAYATWSAGAYYTASITALKGIVTVTGGPRNYQLWHYAESRSTSSDAFGVASDNAAQVNNRYTEIAVIRLK